MRCVPNIDGSIRAGLRGHVLQETHTEAVREPVKRAAGDATTDLVVLPCGAKTRDVCQRTPYGEADSECHTRDCEGNVQALWLSVMRSGK